MCAVAHTTETVVSNQKIQPKAAEHLDSVQAALWKHAHGIKKKENQASLNVKSQLCFLGVM